MHRFKVGCLLGNVYDSMDLIDCNVAFLPICLYLLRYRGKHTVSALESCLGHQIRAALILGEAGLLTNIREKYISFFHVEYFCSLVVLIYTLLWWNSLKEKTIVKGKNNFATDIETILLTSSTWINLRKNENVRQLNYTKYLQSKYILLISATQSIKPDQCKFSILFVKILNIMNVFIEIFFWTKFYALVIVATPILSLL